MIYLASPYSHEDSKIREQRFLDVCKAAAFFMGKGISIFSPIAHTHPIAMAGDLPKGWDFWNKCDRWFIEHCDNVYVLMLDGWEESKGVQAEIAIAHQSNKCISYWNLIEDRVERVK